MLFLATIFVLAFAPIAWSQGHDHGHAQFHDVYRTWKQPGTGVGCCNAKYDDNGHMLGGDCYPTTAWLMPNGWYAMTDSGDVIDIPDDRIVREVNPDESGSRAHLCFNYGKVLCFVPPTGGS